MSNKPSIVKITELLIQKLKGEVMYWQQKALAASEAGDYEQCRQVLQEQAEAIDALIKMAEATRGQVL